MESIIQIHGPAGLEFVEFLFMIFQH
jgi:hypothetical protein